jgi:hypothetical protein
MTEGISQHKRMAMGEAIKEAPGKGTIQKYAMGGAVNKGAVPESKARTLLNGSEQKKSLPKGGVVKIATMKKGGSARGR